MHVVSGIALILGTFNDHHFPHLAQSAWKEFAACDNHCGWACLPIVLLQYSRVYTSLSIGQCQYRRKSPMESVRLVNS